MHARLHQDLLCPAKVAIGRSAFCSKKAILATSVAKISGPALDPGRFPNCISASSKQVQSHLVQVTNSYLEHVAGLPAAPPNCRNCLWLLFSSLQLQFSSLQQLYHISAHPRSVPDLAFSVMLKTIFIWRFDRSFQPWSQLDFFKSLDPKAWFRLHSSKITKFVWAIEACLFSLHGALFLMLPKLGACS